MDKRLFNDMDQARRLAGIWMDATGFAPVQSSREFLKAETGLRLWRYGAPNESTPALLIVPAPIKRHYIWDLSPSTSVVRHALDRGFVVYLAEWTEAPKEYGFDAYVELLGLCVESIENEAGRKPHLLTHSLGGILCAIYGALNPSHIASLSLIETPLHFKAGDGAFSRLLASKTSAHDIAENFGSIPGSFLNLVSAMASPDEFIWQRDHDFLAATRNLHDLRSHLMAMRWTFDEFPLPGRLFAQVVDELFREDRLMRGELTIKDRPVKPEEITFPLTVVMNPRGQVIPPQSMLPFYEAVASDEKQLITYEGDVGVGLQHLGALIGRNAHRDIWPRIFSWVDAREDV
ncbi:MAG TPA: alpha/beta hydrolase [Burkholderiales bacterium]|nr:alpha/beta hydrolase [Burkholderiales bacterium]